VILGLLSMFLVAMACTKSEETPAPEASAEASPAAASPDASPAASDAASPAASDAAPAASPDSDTFGGCPEGPCPPSETP
jgi:hypothetical protein